MIDVEKFVGVMKSAGVDFFARVVNSRLKWCCVCAMACALLPLIFGCVQLDLSKVLVTWGSLGIAKPVELTIWFEESE